MEPSRIPIPATNEVVRFQVGQAPTVRAPRTIGLGIRRTGKRSLVSGSALSLQRWLCQ